MVITLNKIEKTSAWTKDITAGKNQLNLLNETAPLARTHLPVKRWVLKRIKTHIIDCDIHVQLQEEIAIINITGAEHIINWGNFPTELIVVTTEGAELPKKVTLNKRQQGLEQYTPRVLQCY